MRACGMRPGTLAELQEYVDNHREEFYLDGPNDVDWIFRNEVLEGREGALYVDYVAGRRPSLVRPVDVRGLLLRAP
jgi:hypothetical protein